MLPGAHMVPFLSPFSEQGLPALPSKCIVPCLQPKKNTSLIELIRKHFVPYLKKKTKKPQQRVSDFYDQTACRLFLPSGMHFPLTYERH